MPQIHTRFQRPINAFTLVELMVVIAIVAVLLSILLPSLTKAREAARNLHCQVNLKQLAIASIVYSNDHKGIVPYGAYYNPDPEVTVIIDHTFLAATRQILFNDYAVNRAALWMCPLGVYRDYKSINPSYLSDKFYSETSSSSANSNRTNYGYYVGPGRDIANATFGLPEVRRFPNAQDPANRIMWGDPLCWDGPGTRFIGTSGNYMPGNTHDTSGDAYPVAANYVFIDGHVKLRNYRAGSNVKNMSRQYFLYKDF